MADGEGEDCGLTTAGGTGGAAAWVLTDRGWEVVVASAEPDVQVVIWGPGNDDDVVAPSVTVQAGARTWVVAAPPDGTTAVGIEWPDQGTGLARPLP